MFRSPSLRSFDPRAVGSLECRAWETYYRRKWLPAAVAFVALVRAAFGMSWPRTLQGAWYVLRANMKWAPFPDNDPDAARTYMARFYTLLQAAEGLDIDPLKASQLEVEWWRAHREDQHGGGPEAKEGLIRALQDLYAYTYGGDPAAVREAAALRAEAMEVSDRWVEAGCDVQNPLLREERALLVRSFASLLAAVHH